MIKKFVPFLIAASAASFCACNDSQGVEEGSYDEEIFNLTVKLDIDDETQAGSINLRELGEFKTDVNTKNSDTSIPGIPASEVLRRLADKTDLSDAEFDKYLEAYLCEYQSNDDGFKPTDKGERCPLVLCSNTKHAYFSTTAGNVYYDAEAPTQNGCYNIKNISDEDAAKRTPIRDAKILMYKYNPDVRTVWLYIDGSKTGIEVTLNSLPKSQADGKDAVKLSDVLQAASVNLSEYNCDFRFGKDDNTISTTDSSCGVNLCESMKDQLIILDTLAVSDGKPENACYELSDLKAVYLNKAEAEIASYIIKVKKGEVTKEVDIATLADKAVTVNGSKVIYLKDIVDASGLTYGENAKCDYESTDGYRPSDKARCSEIRSCDELAVSYIKLDSHDMTMTDAGDLNCYNASSLSIIEIAD